MLEKSLVWYASYGSNLCRDRFLCYIQGGTPQGSNAYECGCRDRTLPAEDKHLFIEHPLYFAGYSRRWGGGVAFIGSREDKHVNPKSSTLVRMYLIKQEQFGDVVAQENSVSFPVIIPWEQVVEEGKKDLIDSLYGRVVHLGEREGFPIFTFTTARKFEGYTAPSESYLKMLINGLKEAHSYSFSPEQVWGYLADKPGVKDNYNQGRLRELVKSCW
ncbi:hypothetical protein [Candidatus Contubernalis alkaliaceticus]|uniref:hypothetical protein n=1 Tax=Candidatus Contubernalis alkaliaceticus TaxID=338645 RepID=UPI001F4BF905|nr:hypothetical protein [Candidatus Contubernalis alkalaceticus]UNC91206.1 hypothetical protein HUE98_03340 [Candidatus Contubernalis alkalaceticus]